MKCLCRPLSARSHQETESDEQMSPSIVNGTGPETSDTAEEDRVTGAPRLVRMSLPRVVSN